MNNDLEAGGILARALLKIKNLLINSISNGTDRT
jgi:hypothetical protein